MQFQGKRRLDTNCFINFPCCYNTCHKNPNSYPLWNTEVSSTYAIIRTGHNKYI
jgi:hypothetical protein